MNSVAMGFVRGGGGGGGMTSIMRGILGLFWFYSLTVKVALYRGLKHKKSMNLGFCTRKIISGAWSHGSFNFQDLTQNFL